MTPDDLRAIERYLTVPEATLHGGPHDGQVATVELNEDGVWPEIIFRATFPSGPICLRLSESVAVESKLILHKYRYVQRGHYRHEA